MAMICSRRGESGGKNWTLAFSMVQSVAGQISKQLEPEREMECRALFTLFVLQNVDRSRCPIRTVRKEPGPLHAEAGD